MPLLYPDDGENASLTPMLAARLSIGDLHFMTGEGILIIIVSEPTGKVYRVSSAPSPCGDDGIFVFLCRSRQQSEQDFSASSSITPKEPQGISCVLASTVPIRKTLSTTTVNILMRKVENFVRKRTNIILLLLDSGQGVLHLCDFLQCSSRFRIRKCFPYSAGAVSVIP